MHQSPPRAILNPQVEIYVTRSLPALRTKSRHLVFREESESRCERIQVSRSVSNPPSKSILGSLQRFEVETKHNKSRQGYRQHIVLPIVSEDETTEIRIEHQRSFVDLLNRVYRAIRSVKKNGHRRIDLQSTLKLHQALSKVQIQDL